MQLDHEGPRGELAVYLDEERIFSRIAAGRMPELEDIAPMVHLRLFVELTVPDTT
nr:Rdx family protein [Geomonas silvestris]